MYRQPDDVKYHEKLRFLNKSYFNKIYIVLVLSFTYMAFDVFIKKRMKLVKLSALFQVFRVSILIELAFSLKFFEQCFNYKGKLKKYFMVT